MSKVGKKQTNNSWQATCNNNEKTVRKLVIAQPKRGSNRKKYISILLML